MSIRRVDMPRAASSAPRLVAVVVLPTPPFWFAIASTTGISDRLRFHVKRWKGGPEPGLFAHLQICRFAPRRACPHSVRRRSVDAVGGASSLLGPLARGRDRDLARLAF